MSTSYLVTRLPFQGTPSTVAVCESRIAANIMIAQLEAKDPKGSLVFYERTPVKASVAKVASDMSLWAD